MPDACAFPRQMFLHAGALLLPSAIFRQAPPPCLTTGMFYKQQIGVLLSSLDVEETVTGCCDSPQSPVSSAHDDSQSSFLACAPLAP